MSSSKSESRGKTNKTLRTVRKIHRISSAWLFIFFMIIAVSGLLLGWKKNSGDLLLPSTRQGSTSGLSGWMPVDSLAIIARKTLKEEVSPGLSPEIDRMDIRPSRGIIKFVFKHHYWGIQLDGKTGEVLHVGRRNSDLIENIHDGSVIDRMLGSGRIGFKLVYTSLTGLSLLLFTITGIWLWTGRNRIKKQKRTWKGMYF